MYIIFGIFGLLLLLMILVNKFCQKKSKIVLSCLIIIITIYFLELSIDMNRVNSMRKPIFVWETNNRVGARVKESVYQGLGYKVYIEYSDANSIISINMRMFGKIISGAVT